MKTTLLTLMFALPVMGGPTSGLAPLTTPAAGDLINVVDVSDTTMAVTGTNKAVTWANMFNGPTLIAPLLGTPVSGNFSSGTFTWPTFAVTSGGTGRATGTTAYALIATGTTATGAQQSLAAGATTEILVGGGASALPVWTTATGSGAPVRGTAPTITSPTLGTSVTVSSGTTFSYGDSAAKASHRSGMGIADVAIFNQTSASGTDGASFTGSTWSKAPLNTTIVDPSTAFTVSSSVLTVTSAGAGRWIVRGCVVMQDYGSGLLGAKGRLRRTNNTATTLAMGDAQYYTGYATARSFVLGSVTLVAGDTLELQGWAGSATPTFGKAVSSGDSEIYSTIEFTRQ